MATTGIVNTKLIKIQYNDAPNTPIVITCLTNAEFTLNNETFDTTCKDDGQWRTLKAGQSTATLSGELYYSEDATNGAPSILVDALAQNKVEWVFGSGVSGDTRLSGQGYFTSTSISAPGQNEGATMSFEIAVTGAVTKSTFS